MSCSEINDARDAASARSYYWLSTGFKPRTCLHDRPSENPSITPQPSSDVSPVYQTRRLLVATNRRKCYASVFFFCWCCWSLQRRYQVFLSSTSAAEWRQWSWQLVIYLECLRAHNREIRAWSSSSSGLMECGVGFELRRRCNFGSCDLLLPRGLEYVQLECSLF